MSLPAADFKSAFLQDMKILAQFLVGVNNDYDTSNKEKSNICQHQTTFLEYKSSADLDLILYQEPLNQESLGLQTQIYGLPVERIV